MSQRGGDWRGGGGGSSSRGDGGRGRGGGGGGGGGGRGGSFPRGGRGGGGGGSRGGSSGGASEVFRDPMKTNMLPNPQVTKVEDDYIKGSQQIGKLGTLSLSDTFFPRRPGHGTQGRHITVWANYFEVLPTPNLTFFRYDVKITPMQRAPEPSRMRKKQIFALILDSPGATGVMTDFKTMLISPTRLPGMPVQFELAYKAEGEDEPSATAHKYRVDLDETAVIPVSELLDSLKSTDASAPAFGGREVVIQALNVVMGHYPQTQTEIATIGQNRHFPTTGNATNIRVLPGGMAALRGFFKSIRAGTSRILLNINVSHAVCYEPVRLDNLMGKFGTANKVSLGKYLKRVRVIRKHLKPRKNKKGQDIQAVKTIWDLAKERDGFHDPKPPRISHYAAGPKNVRFFLKETAGDMDGKYVSVWEYFRKNYPSIQMDEKYPVVNVGSDEKPSYLPAEALQVLPGQPIGRKLTPEATREMIAFAVRTPKANAESIVKDGRAILGLDQPLKAGLTRFGLTISASMITVPARVLAPPSIKYGQKTVSTRFGSWNMDGVKFNVGKNISQWTYIWIKSNRRVPQGFTDERHLRTTVEAFTNLMRTTGVAITPPISTPAPPTLELMDGQDAENDAKIGDILRRMSFSPKKPTFLLIVLPYNDAAIYRKIKTVADIKAGIHTVCVVGTKFAKEARQEQYFANVALKFNLKAGGTNQIIDASKLGIISQGKTMVVGIDVTHPSPGSKSTAPSIAGIVASIDKELAQWPADLRIQEGKKEMVTDLTDLVKSRLNLWRERNKALPDNILIYRDGVSEGQYQLVLEQELPFIRAACEDVYPATSKKQGLPKVSIIIVGKRHHTRFYPIAEQDADRSSNCQNGTVVDRGVTDVRMWDFYLQAHTCLQGTARPAHYVVILDEIFLGKKPMNPLHKHAADTLEDLTHNMCHLFGRATKAISICPPAYYADLLCERARCYLGRLYEPPTPSGTTAGSTTGSEADASADEVLVHQTLRDTMFYI